MAGINYLGDCVGISGGGIDYTDQLKGRGGKRKTRKCCSSGLGSPDLPQTASSHVTSEMPVL